MSQTNSNSKSTPDTSTAKTSTDYAHTEHDLLNMDLGVYPSILDAITDGWWDWNLTTNEEYLSPGFKALFGYADHEIANSVESWQQLIFDEDFEIAKENVAKHLASNGQHPYFQEVRYHHKDGHTIWVICRGQGIIDADGEIRRIVGTHTDITPQKILTEQLLYANKELDQFAHAVSHDLRSPLRNIRSIISWIKDDVDCLSQADLIKKLCQLNQRAEKLETMINDILQYARAGSQDIVNDSFNTTSFYQELLSLVDASGVDIRLPEQSFTVNAPMTVFRQIFLNLLTNAIKYNDKTKPVIQIRQRQLIDKLEFCIEDNGHPIDKAAQAKIFQLFYTTSSDGHISSGLGLTLVKRLVTKYGGHVQYQDSSLGGAAFCFTWPIHMDQKYILRSGGNNDDK